MDIILLLKRGTGMSVNELSAALRMSYMGVKQHCVYLDKKGYVNTWRRPKPAGGRPEKMYVLSPKLDALFPRLAGQIASELLEEAERAYGASAPLRLLTGFFQTQGEAYQSSVKGRTLVERAQAMARQRMQDGCLSYSEFDAHLGLRIVEYHSPVITVIDRFPDAGELEAKMVARVLQCQVERVDLSIEHVTRIEFRLRPYPE